MSQDLVSWLARNVVTYMRSDVIARFVKGPNGQKMKYQCVERRIESEDIEGHIYRDQPLGLYLMSPDTDGYTRCAVVDIDDKTGKYTWDELVQEAKKIDDQLASHLLLSWSCRSGSGHGIHLWLFWREPQPTKIVRQLLLRCVVDSGVVVHVDLFPAQDTLGGTLGNLVALPFGRKSRPLDMELGYVVEDLAMFAGVDPALSAPVIKPGPVQTKRQANYSGVAPDWAIGADNNTQRLDDYGAPDVPTLKEALRFIGNTDYGTWMRIGLALKGAASEGLLEDDTAFEIWDSWSETAANYNPREQDYQWGRFRPRPNGVGLGTLWFLAQEGGWKRDEEDLVPRNMQPTIDQLERARLAGNRQQNVSLPKDDPTLVLTSPLKIHKNEGQADLTVVDEGQVESTLALAPEEDPLNSQSVDPIPLMSERLGGSSKDPLPHDPIGADDQLWTTGGGEDEVKNMNVRHFMTVDGGKAAVFREEWDPVMHRQYLMRINVHDFQLFYKNRQVLLRTTKQGKPVYKPLGDLWVESPFRRQYRKIVLRPEGCAVDEYNLWRGWTIKANEEGSWSLLQEHIRDNLCMGNKEAFEYVLNWWAMTFQRPETPIGVALVLRGSRGTGKSSFVRAFGEIFGQHFLHVVNSRSIVGNFNSHLRDCAVLFADEAVWAGNRSEESTLKGIITEPTLTIEGKGRDSINCRNMIHLVIATNHDWAVPAGMDERRFCILEVGEGKKQDSSFFQSIQRQLRTGGQERLLHDMLTRDISKFNPAKVPVTKEMTKQKILSLEPWAAWWYQCLIDGQFYPQHSSWDKACRVDLVHQGYVEFVRGAGMRQTPCTVQMLTSQVRKMIHGHLSTRRMRMTNEFRIADDETGYDKLISLWKMPDLLTCRRYFEIMLGDRLTWDDVEDVCIGETNRIIGDDPTLI